MGNPGNVGDLLPQSGADWGVLVSAGSSVVAVLAMLGIAARELLRRVDRRRPPTNAS